MTPKEVRIDNVAHIRAAVDWFRSKEYSCISKSIGLCAERYIKKHGAAYIYVSHRGTIDCSNASQGFPELNMEFDTKVSSVEIKEKMIAVGDKKYPESHILSALEKYNG